MNDIRGTQINKYVSMQGICSRREADEWIKLGRVRINGKVAKVQDRVKPTDKVTVDDEYVGASRKEKVATYMLFNKPAGLTTTTDERDKTSVTRFIDYHKRIFPVGRLDKDSEGLLILTDDGDIVNKILRAGNRHDKEYEVEVDKALTPEVCAALAAGVPILGTTTLPCVVKQEGNRKFRIILQQGLNRQIRRMCEHFGYTVKRLTRVRIMHLRVDGIRLGGYRLMTTTEIQQLQKVLGESKNEEMGKRGSPVSGAFGSGGVNDGVSASGGARGAGSVGRSGRNNKWAEPLDDEDIMNEMMGDAKPVASRNTYWSDRKRGKRAEKEGITGKAGGLGFAVGDRTKKAVSGSKNSGAGKAGGASKKSGASAKLVGPAKGLSATKASSGGGAKGSGANKLGGSKRPLKNDGKAGAVAKGKLAGGAKGGKTNAKPKAASKKFGKNR